VKASYRAADAIAILASAAEAGTLAGPSALVGYRLPGIVSGSAAVLVAAPCILDGPINAESFLAWVMQFLVPILWPGDIVVKDNLSSHKAPAIRQAIRTAGAKLFYLPPYSPDLNPIEQAFSKLKTLLRKANARSFEQVQVAIARLLKAITPQECRNFFVHAGYTST
jgi:transposase